MAEARKTAQSKDRELAKREEELEAAKEALTFALAGFAEKEAEFTERIAQLEATASLEAGRAGALEEETDRLKKELARGGNLTAREAELKRLTHAAEEREKSLAASRLEVDERSKALQRRDVDVSKREKSLTAREGEVTATDKALRDRERSIRRGEKGLEERTRSSDETVKKKEEELEQRERKLAATLSDRSLRGPDI